jgi:hypothetical protein
MRGKDQYHAVAAKGFAIRKREIGNLRAFVCSSGVRVLDRVVLVLSIAVLVLDLLLGIDRVARTH